MSATRKPPADADSPRVPTVDGRRVEVKDLNLGDVSAGDKDHAGPVRRLFRSLTLFAAGMYTGVKCGGIPHSHHTYSRDRDDGPI